MRVRDPEGSQYHRDPDEIWTTSCVLSAAKRVIMRIIVGIGTFLVTEVVSTGRGGTAPQMIELHPGFLVVGRPPVCSSHAHFTRIGALLMHTSEIVGENEYDV